MTMRVKLLFYKVMHNLLIFVFHYRKRMCMSSKVGLHSKNRLVERTKKLVDIFLTKLLVKITNPSLINYKYLTNHIG